MSIVTPSSSSSPQSQVNAIALNGVDFNISNLSTGQSQNVRKLFENLQKNETDAKKYNADTLLDALQTLSEHKQKVIKTLTQNQQKLVTISQEARMTAEAAKQQLQKYNEQLDQMAGGDPGQGLPKCLEIMAKSQRLEQSLEELKVALIQKEAEIDQMTTTQEKVSSRLKKLTVQQFKNITNGPALTKLTISNIPVAAERSASTPFNKVYTNPLAMQTPTTNSTSLSKPLSQSKSDAAASVQSWPLSQSSSDTGQSGSRIPARPLSRSRSNAAASVQSASRIPARPLSRSSSGGAASGQSGSRIPAKGKQGLAGPNGQNSTKTKNQTS